MMINIECTKSYETLHPFISINRTNTQTYPSFKRIPIPLDTPAFELFDQSSKLPKIHRILILSILAMQCGYGSGQMFSQMSAQLPEFLTNVVQSFTSNSSESQTVRQIINVMQNPSAMMTMMSQNGTQSQMLGLLLQLKDQTDKVDGTCLQHMMVMVQNLGKEDWAMRMLDAMAKPPAGLMNFKLLWPGDWGECISTKAMVNVTGSNDKVELFNGKYCPITIPIPGVPGPFGMPVQAQLGACFPDSCSSGDIFHMIVMLNYTLSSYNVSIPQPYVLCKENELPLDTQAIIVLAVCAVFIAIMTLATLYDVVYIQWLVKSKSVQRPYQNGTQFKEELKAPEVYIVTDEKNPGSLSNGYEMNHQTNHVDTMPPQKPEPSKQEDKYTPSTLEGLLLSFSVYTNGTKILNTHQPKGALTAINGIRFISMSWVIVGHTYAWLAQGGSGTLEGLLLSFSVYTNGTKILNTDQPKGALTAINGIRFISMSWVIVGHTYGWLAQGGTDNFGQFAGDLMTRREFTPIVNGTFSVDTFFVLSGLLLTYLSLKEMKKRGGAKNFRWGMYYFHRIWRLTPPYMLLMMIWVTFDKYLGDGPMWPQQGIERETCKHSWWTNILYINNLVKVGDDRMLGCMGHTWYLANDMQFYVISPLLLIPLFYFPVVGGLACLAVLGGSAVAAGLISINNDLPSSTIFEQAKQESYMWDYYVKPWCRIGPYMVGMFTGYMLYRSKLNMKINKFVNVALWLVSIVLGALIIYGLYTEDFQDPLDKKTAAIYNATSRSVWGACVAWVIFACANSYGGPINVLLSWPGFVPLGRLTYFAYLVHPSLMTIYQFSAQSLQTLYTYGTIYTILGHMCMAYGVAFVLSLAFEAPMMGLEKVLLGRGKNS